MTQHDHESVNHPVPASEVYLTRNEDNLLNLHYTDLRNKCRRSTCRIVYLRKINEQNKQISVRVQVQTKIPKFVMGTHKTLTNHYVCISNGLTSVKIKELAYIAGLHVTPLQISSSLLTCHALSCAFVTFGVHLV